MKTILVSLALLISGCSVKSYPITADTTIQTVPYKHYPGLNDADVVSIQQIIHDYLEKYGCSK